jgi:deoxyxylulose-5-phosphate synthase
MNNEGKSKDLESMFKELLDKSLQNMEEERDLSLERYRRQDETIVSPEDFVLQGKFAVDYLKVAAERSNSMIGVAKMLKDIIYKEGTSSETLSSSGAPSDDLKREIFKYIKEDKNNSTE